MGARVLYGNLLFFNILVFLYIKLMYLYAILFLSLVGRQIPIGLNALKAKE